MRLEREDAEAAEKLAAERGISLSELMRRVLRSYLKRQKRR
jgi:predicted HicB family RNase H-like nuclease